MTKSQPFYMNFTMRCNLHHICPNCINILEAEKLTTKYNFMSKQMKDENKNKDYEIVKYFSSLLNSMKFVEILDYIKVRFNILFVFHVYSVTNKNNYSHKDKF